MTTDEQLARLPRHAQETIGTLRRVQRELEQKIKDLEAELTGDRTTDSRVFYSEGGMTFERRPLPRHAYIDFRLHNPKSPARSWELRALVREEEDDVYVDINGDSTITVTPMASNSIQIRLKDRFS